MNVAQMTVIGIGSELIIGCIDRLYSIWWALGQYRYSSRSSWSRWEQFWEQMGTDNFSELDSSCIMCCLPFGTGESFRPTGDGALSFEIWKGKGDTKDCNN